MTPLKVAIYSPYAESFYAKSGRNRPASGGAEYQTTKLAAGLAAQGLEVSHIIYPIVDVDPQRAGRVRLVMRSHYRGEGGALNKVWEAIAIWRALLKARSDVYILRGFGLQIPVGIVFGKLMRRKVIFSGSNDIDFTPESRDSARGAVATIYRKTIAGADLIVAQTDQQGRIARKHFPDRPIEVIRSFCEPAEPLESEDQKDDRPYFLWVGRLVDYKRPFAYLNLAKAVPEATFRMLYVPTADTPDSLTTRILAEGADIPNLEFLEPQPRDRVLEMTERAQAMVLTSEAEGMPNVLLEAWMRGVPAVSLSFDPDGVIRRHELGLVADDDPEKLAEAVRLLNEDAQLRHRMGEKGRDFVMRNHSPDVVAKRWADAVRGLA